MALFVFHGIDKPGALEIRKATRPSHLAWLETLQPRVKIGGPMLAEDGATPVGSMLVLEVDTLAEAKARKAEESRRLMSLVAFRCPSNVSLTAPHVGSLQHPKKMEAPPSSCSKRLLTEPAQGSPLLLSK